MPGSIVWIAFGTTIYRCAPEQIRAATTEEEEIARNLGGMFFDAARPPQLDGFNGYKDVSREIPTFDEAEDSETVSDPLQNVPTSAPPVGASDFPGVDESLGMDDEAEPEGSPSV